MSNAERKEHGSSPAARMFGKRSTCPQAAARAPPAMCSATAGRDYRTSCLTWGSRSEEGLLQLSFAVVRPLKPEQSQHALFLATVLPQDCRPPLEVADKSWQAVCQFLHFSSQALATGSSMRAYLLQHDTQEGSWKQPCQSRSPSG
eukprot:123258-Hanusia_phi.AAC.8